MRIDLDHRFFHPVREVAKVRSEEDQIRRH